MYIFRLYSSPENVKSGNMVWLGGLKTNCDDIMILVHTTTPLCLNSNGLNTLNNKSTTFVSDFYNVYVIIFDVIISILVALLEEHFRFVAI